MLFDIYDLFPLLASSFLDFDFEFTDFFDFVLFVDLRDAFRVVPVFCGLELSFEIIPRPLLSL